MIISKFWCEERQHPTIIIIINSALVQGYNSVLLHDSFVREDYSE